MTKEQLRKEARERRRRVATGGEDDGAGLRHLLSLEEFQSSRCVLTYVSTAEEFPTRSVLVEIQKLGKLLCVPWCRQGEILPVEIHGEEDLAPGIFGIPEPIERIRTHATRIVPPNKIDLAIVPGLAFDTFGHRLGFGQGYFDRFLTTLRSDAMMVGFAFEAQMYQEIPVEPHDISMDVIITEDRVIRIRKGYTG